MLDFSAAKQNKKKAPPTKRKGSDHSVSKSPYDYNERNTRKRGKLTLSMIDLKLRKPSRAKSKVQQKEVDLSTEIEEDPDQPSTSGYFLPQECSLSELESVDDVRSLRSTRLKRRRISNRDSSNDTPQKRKLFTSNNSPTSDNLTPRTPFTWDNSQLKKKTYQKLIGGKMNQDIKDVRIILNKDWLDKKMDQTDSINTGQNFIPKELACKPQQSPHRQKDENKEAIMASRPETKESSGGDHDSGSNTDTQVEDLSRGTGSLVLFSD